MRSLVIFVWCVVILIFTCTASFQDLIHFGVLSFRWDGQPMFSEFLSPFPSAISKSLLFQKLGHIAAFHFLALLALMKFRSIPFILIMTASFAALTEVLQLYFSRGGRLFDIGFDLIGILAALGMVTIIRAKQSKQINFDN
ncbi:VanZ family protein [Neobacillus drentensis]|uniref:VanZ family protein n=1 Tax=Neobacillus drentensis TaxID=220684 RepID=UPI002FFF5C66